MCIYSIKEKMNFVFESVYQTCVCAKRTIPNTKKSTRMSPDAAKIISISRRCHDRILGSAIDLGGKLEIPVRLRVFGLVVNNQSDIQVLRSTKKRANLTKF